MATRKIQVVYEPDEGGWHVYAPEIQGCRSWGRSISAARKYIREAISVCEDVLGADAARIAEAAELTEEFRLPAAARRELERAVEARREAEARASAAQAAASRAAKTLTKKVGLSLRDAGALLGLSHERIKQLTESTAR